MVVGVRYLSRTLGLDDPFWMPPEGSLADSDRLTLPPPPLAPDLVEKFLPTRDLLHHQQMTSTLEDEEGSSKSMKIFCQVGILLNEVAKCGLDNLIPKCCRRHMTGTPSLVRRPGVAGWRRGRRRP